MDNKPMIIVNGMPGKIGTLIGKRVHDDDRYELYPNSLTGPNMPPDIQFHQHEAISLIEPKFHETVLDEFAEYENKIVIDACKGEGVADQHAKWYCERNIPFVMLSTGVSNEYKDIRKLAEETRTRCAAAPNMDPKIASWIAGIKYMAENFPGAWEGSEFILTETHQGDKINKNTGEPETSGTMKHMLTDFGKLGNVKLTIEDILSVRDPIIQRNLFKVPEKCLGWHAYHVFKVKKGDDSECLEFERHGGDSYVDGTMMALDALVEGRLDKWYNNMEDVLRSTKNR